MVGRHCCLIGGRERRGGEKRVVQGAAAAAAAAGGRIRAADETVAERAEQAFVDAGRGGRARRVH